MAYDRYNAEGLRVQKRVNRVGASQAEITNYTLHGKLITHLTKGSEKLHFVYDAQSRPALVQHNVVWYGYVHNLQGDIIAIVDANGMQVVEYKYDAWDRKLSVTGTKASTLGALNPFRYRGYVFDEETYHYYLRSRYYNPAVGRFISADTALGNGKSMLRYNLYAYCDSSMVRKADIDGQVSVNVADSIIRDNAASIIEAAAEYEVDPQTLAGVYTRNKC